MAVRFCPVCQYPLKRTNHPQVGMVRFCRISCVNAWKAKRGLPPVPEGNMPYGVDRRMAVASAG